MLNNFVDAIDSNWPENDEHLKFVEGPEILEDQCVTSFAALSMCFFSLLYLVRVDCLGGGDTFSVLLVTTQLMSIENVDDVSVDCGDRHRHSSNYFH